MSTKEDDSGAGEPGQAWSGQFAERLQEHRRRAESLLRAERERLCGASGALQQQLQTLADRLDQQRAAIERRESELEQRVEELDRGRAELDRQRREVEDARAQWGQEREEADRRQEALLADFRQEQERLQQQREQLESLLREIEERSAAWAPPRSSEAPPAGSPRAEPDGDDEPSEELAHLQERFELAVQDVRALKQENADLLEELAALRQAGASPAAGLADGLDWESQKQKVLAQLESDLDESQPEEAHDKLTVEGAIRITDQVVVEKEQEIRELKRLLSERNAAIGDVAVGAAAVQEVLDQDALIVEERENLQRLQESWREKLRQAEIEISVERAKLARARADLEEQMRSYESSGEKGKEGPGGRAAAGKSAKASGGKWLARLGLSGSDDDN